MMRKQEAVPVEKKQTIALTITALGSDGQGIGRHEGFVVFVPFALPGETVETLIIKVASGYAVGKLLRVLEPSPRRTEVRCPVFGRCGGCQLQHLEYAAQLEFKRTVVVDALRGIGGINEPDVKPVIGMEEPWRYRNKGIFPVGVARGEAVLGMYAPRSHTVIGIEDCPLQPEPVCAAMNAVHRWIRDYGISVYDESTGRGLVRHVMARSFAETGDAVVVLITNGTTLPHREELIAALRDAVPGLVGVVQNINAENTNVVLGKRDIVLWGRGSVGARLDALAYDVKAQSFFQVNTTQMQRLYAAAGEAAGLTGNELVIDAYCGVGTIGQSMAPYARKVIGIEAVPESVEEARISARRNGIDNVEYLCGKAEDVFAELSRKGVRPDVIVMDPPRKGCDPRFLDAAAMTGAPKLVYVSCNPATMARDVKHLIGKGYALGSVQPVDMFPQTADVESTVLMTNGGSEGK